jgi:hypothetical protein
VKTLPLLMAKELNPRFVGVRQTTLGLLPVHWTTIFSWEIPS